MKNNGIDCQISYIKTFVNVKNFGRFQNTSFLLQSSILRLSALIRKFDDAFFYFVSPPTPLETQRPQS